LVLFKIVDVFVSSPASCFRRIWVNATHSSISKQSKLRSIAPFRLF
jgi:hypothetical protein